MIDKAATTTTPKAASRKLAARPRTSRLRRKRLGIKAVVVARKTEDRQRKAKVPNKAAAGELPTTATQTQVSQFDRDLISVLTPTLSAESKNINNNSGAGNNRGKRRGGNDNNRRSESPPAKGGRAASGGAKDGSKTKQPVVIQGKRRAGEPLIIQKKRSHK